MSFSNPNCLVVTKSKVKIILLSNFYMSMLIFISLWGCYVKVKISVFKMKKVTILLSSILFKVDRMVLLIVLIVSDLLQVSKKTVKPCLQHTKTNYFQGQKNIYGGPVS
jgi:hypothetical protein